MKKYFMLSLAVVFGVSLMMGCAGAPKIGSEKIIERSAAKSPDWILNPFVEQKGYFYFSGGVTGRQSLNLGNREAKAEAIKNVAEGISVKVRTEFTGAIRGSNINEDDIGDFTQDAIGMVTDNLDIQGLMPEELYWEKVEKVVGPHEVKNFYNCYCLVKMSVADYKKSRDIALNGLADKAKKERDKKAEETATLLMEKLSK